MYDRLLFPRRRSQSAAHEHEQDMLRIKTPLTYCGDEAIVALPLLSGMNIFSFDNSMFGAYEQDADDGMLGIVSSMQYVHLPAGAPNVAIVYGASGEMYQPESGVRQGGEIAAAATSATRRRCCNVLERNFSALKIVKTRLPWRSEMTIYTTYWRSTSIWTC